MMRLGIGVDMVDVREIEASIARFGDRYLERIYTAGELWYARSGETARRLGARFAAKEAVLKVLGATEVGIDWRAIEVVRTRDGAPQIALFGTARDVAVRAGIGELSLSLTHQGDLATAVVVATRRAGPSRLSWSLPKSRRNRG